MSGIVLKIIFVTVMAKAAIWIYISLARVKKQRYLVTPPRSSK